MVFINLIEIPYLYIFILKKLEISNRNTIEGEKALSNIHDLIKYSEFCTTVL
jgi:hypothetical protein